MGTLTITFVGPVVGTATDVFQVSDADAVRITTAYTALYTQTPHPGKQSASSRRGEAPAPATAPLTASDVAHLMSADIWNTIKSYSEKYEQRNAATAAAAGVPPITHT